MSSKYNFFENLSIQPNQKRPLPPGLTPPIKRSPRKVVYRGYDTLNEIPEGRTLSSRSPSPEETIVHRLKRRRTAEAKQLAKQLQVAKQIKREEDQKKAIQAATYEAAKLQEEKKGKTQTFYNRLSHGLAATGAAVSAAVGVGLVAPVALPAAAAVGTLAGLTAAIYQLQQAWFADKKKDALSKEVLTEMLNTLGVVELYLKRKGSAGRNAKSREMISVTEKKLDQVIKFLTEYIYKNGDSSEVYSRKLLMFCQILTSLIQQLILIK
jgi:hypothetical protein